MIYLVTSIGMRCSYFVMKFLTVQRSICNSQEVTRVKLGDELVTSFTDLITWSVNVMRPIAAQSAFQDNADIV